tara:strand:+ start:1320 stop:2090 length:771 start_codon:yes stop_codon:yes gene_type:complete
LAGRIYLVNVGTNAAHRFCSPIFQDRTFEFIPIPEDRFIPQPNGVLYGDLHSFYDPSKNLDSYIPKRFLEETTHNDPEFDTFSYGDNCDVNPRAMSLRNVERGDFLMFIARLNHWLPEGGTDRYGFFLVGYLHVDHIISSVTSIPLNADLERFSSNAHIRRAMYDSSLWDSFWIFGGSSWSRRFHKAVPVTREICDQIFRAADGSKWKWGMNEGGRSDLQVIGSYTRTCRCSIDPGTEDGAKRAILLWKWIESYSD